VVSDQSIIGTGDLQHPAFVVDVSDVEGFVVVTVTGEVDLDSAPLLQAALDPVAADREVILDCAALHFMDSTGLQLIVTQAQRLTAGGGSLKLRHTSFPVRHVVEITGMIQLFELDG
jgi:anti-sigma B factor antagonist